MTFAVATMAIPCMRVLVYTVTIIGVNSLVIKIFLNHFIGTNIATLKRVGVSQEQLLYRIT